MLTNGQQKPDNERQIRPLVGLAPEQAQLAWDHAVKLAGKGNITERLVKKAVKELQLTGAVVPVAPPPRRSIAKQRRLVGDAIAELIVLIRQKAAYEVLTEKMEALLGRFESLYPKKTKQ